MLNAGQEVPVTLKQNWLSSSNMKIPLGMLVMFVGGTPRAPK